MEEKYIIFVDLEFTLEGQTQEESVFLTKGDVENLAQSKLSDDQSFDEVRVLSMNYGESGQKLCKQVGKFLPPLKKILIAEGYVGLAENCDELLETLKQANLEFTQNSQE